MAFAKAVETSGTATADKLASKTWQVITCDIARAI